MADGEPSSGHALLRDCADPNNLPFSNENEDGFENKLAHLVAGALGQKLSYVWWAQHGGMGPSLSTRSFKFAADPANHFVVIAHGAPLGMPAWGELLPETVIWDLVSYIGSIRHGARWMPDAASK